MARGAYSPRAVPCSCGSCDAYWHGPEEAVRYYCCDACWGAGELGRAVGRLPDLRIEEPIPVAAP